MDQKAAISINDLKVRREILIPEDISRSGKVEFASFRLDHIDAALGELGRLAGEVERLKALAATLREDCRHTEAHATAQLATERERGREEMRERAALAAENSTVCGVIGGSVAGLWRTAISDAIRALPTKEDK